MVTKMPKIKVDSPITASQQQDLITKNAVSATFDAETGFDTSVLTPQQKQYYDYLKSIGTKFNTEYASAAQASFAKMNGVPNPGTPSTSTDTAPALGQQQDSTIVVPPNINATEQNSGVQKTVQQGTQQATGTPAQSGQTAQTNPQQTQTPSETETTPALTPEQQQEQELRLEYGKWLLEHGYKFNTDYLDVIRQYDANLAKELSDYAAKAEQLANRGLGNSGYSDYIDSAAYAEAQQGKADALKDKQDKESAAYAAFLQEKEANDANVQAALAALISGGGDTSANIAALKAQFGDTVTNSALEQYTAYKQTDAYLNDNQSTIQEIASYFEQRGGTITDVEKQTLVTRYGQQLFDAGEKLYADVKAENDTAIGTQIADVTNGKVSLDEYLSSKGYDISTMDESAKETAYFNSIDEWYNGISNPTDEQKAQYVGAYQKEIDLKIEEAKSYKDSERINAIGSIFSFVNTNAQKFSNYDLTNMVSQIEKELGFELGKEGTSFTFIRKEGKKALEFMTKGDYIANSGSNVGNYLYALPQNISVAVYKDYGEDEAKCYARDYVNGTWYEVKGIGKGAEIRAWITEAQIQILKSNISGEDAISNSNASQNQSTSQNASSTQKDWKTELEQEMKNLAKNAKTAKDRDMIVKSIDQVLKSVNEQEARKLIDDLRSFLQNSGN